MSFRQSFSINSDSAVNASSLSLISFQVFLFFNSNVKFDNNLFTKSALVDNVVLTGDIAVTSSIV